MEAAEIGFGAFGHLGHGIEYIYIIPKSHTGAKCANQTCKQPIMIQKEQGIRNYAEYDIRQKAHEYEPLLTHTFRPMNKNQHF